MKSYTRIKIILLISLGIIFVLSTIINNNLEFNPGRNDKKVNYNEDITLENKNLKISKTSGTIHIDGNSGWFAAMIAGICTGNGTYSEPYVIKDLVIDGGSSESCILIENSNVFFKIENCSTYASDRGMHLSHVANSILIDNNCSANDIGIYLHYSHNNTIAGNTLNYNHHYGIALLKSDHNNILGNDVSYNYNGILLKGGYDALGARIIKDNLISGNIVKNNDNGILLSDSSNNNISNNTVINNNMDGVSLYTSYRDIVSGNVISNNLGNGIFLSICIFSTLSENAINYNRIGIYLSQSNFNNVTGNTLIGNSICWEEFECDNNIFENNNCSIALIIKGYNLFFLIDTFSLVIIMISKKVKKLGIKEGSFIKYGQRK